MPVSTAHLWCAVIVFAGSCRNETSPPLHENGSTPDKTQSSLVVRYKKGPPPDCLAATKKTNDEGACWRVDPKSGRAFVQVSASCGITDRGDLECWKPALARIPRGRFVLVDDTGTDACAARATGGVVCWGDAPWPSVPDSDSFVALSMGGSFRGESDEGVTACGLTGGGDIECWGDGSPHWSGKHSIKGPFVAVGLGQGRIAGLKRDGSVELHGGLSDVVVHRGPIRLMDVRGATCLVPENGAVSCQGGMWFLGSESPPGDLNDVRLVRSGYDHACALSRDGTVRCWGDARTPPNLNFAYISQPDDRDSYCGIALDGHAYCWGDPSSDPRPEIPPLSK
jgi:hypothetical protein